MDVSHNEKSEAIAHGIKNKVPLVCYSILLFFWDVMFLFYTYITIFDNSGLDNNFFTTILITLFTFVINLMFVWILFNYIGMEVFLTNEFIIICKNNKLLKKIPNSKVSFSSIGIVHYIFDEQSKSSILPFMDIQNIKDNLNSMGYTNINHKTNKKDIIITVFAILFIICFKYYQHNTNIANIRKDTQSYMNYMQYLIKKNWQPPTEINNRTVVVEYTILKSGKITNVNIVQSSNDASLDSSSVNAINKIKLPPLPDDIDRDYITTTFTFKKN